MSQYRYVRPQRVWILHHFCLKTGQNIDFAPAILMWNWVWFIVVTTEVYERICRLNLK